MPVHMLPAEFVPSGEAEGLEFVPVDQRESVLVGLMQRELLRATGMVSVAHGHQQFRSCCAPQVQRNCLSAGSCAVPRHSHCTWSRPEQKSVVAESYCSAQIFVLCFAGQAGSIMKQSAPMRSGTASHVK